MLLLEARETTRHLLSQPPLAQQQDFPGGAGRRPAEPRLETSRPGGYPARMHRPFPARHAVAHGLALLALVASVGPQGASAREKAPQRGVSLGLFGEDAGWSYRPLLDEIAATGADHVELVVAVLLDDVHARRCTSTRATPPPLVAVERAVRDAHAAGLAVFLFPSSASSARPSPSEWRGTLATADRDALFALLRPRPRRARPPRRQDRRGALLRRQRALHPRRGLRLLGRDSHGTSAGDSNWVKAMTWTWSGTIWGTEQPLGVRRRWSAAVGEDAAQRL